MVDPTDDAVLLFLQGAEVRQRELWVWQGNRFVSEATGIFPGYVFGRDLFHVSACPIRTVAVRCCVDG